MVLFSFDVCLGEIVVSSEDPAGSQMKVVASAGALSALNTPNSG